MTKNSKNTQVNYNELLEDIKQKATTIYEKLSSNQEDNLENDKKFVKKSLDTVKDLLENADFHNRDFLLELESYLKRIDSMLEHIEDTEDENKKGSILHRFKYTILKSLLDLEYEIGSI